MKKYEAIIATGLTADIFRTVCEKIGKDPDQEYFFGLDVNDIKDYAVRNGYVTFSNSSLQDGYTIEEAAEILNVSKQNFSINYAKKAVKIRRGCYSKESINALASAKNDKSDTIDDPQTETIKVSKTKGVKKLQRITVSETTEGVSITLHLENYTQSEVLAKLIKLFN